MLSFGNPLTIKIGNGMVANSAVFLDRICSGIMSTCGLAGTINIADGSMPIRLAQVCLIPWDLYVPVRLRKSP